MRPCWNKWVSVNEPSGEICSLLHIQCDQLSFISAAVSSLSWWTALLLKFWAKINLPYVLLKKKISVDLVLVTAASVSVYNEHVMSIIQYFTVFLQPLLSSASLRKFSEKMGVWYRWPIPKWACGVIYARSFDQLWVSASIHCINKVSLAKVYTTSNWKVCD